MLEKKTILIGRSIHSAFGWALSAWFWTKAYGWNLWLSIAPICLGTVYLRSNRYLAWAARGVLASLAFLGRMVLSVRERYGWATVLTQFSVFVLRARRIRPHCNGSL